MPVVFTPHSAQVVRATTTPVSGIASETTFATIGGTIAGSHHRKTPQFIEDAYGIGSERPSVFLASDNALSAVQGDRLRISGVDYTLLLDPIYMGAEAVTAHYVYVLEEVRG
jgi:hypothetical protein